MLASLLAVIVIQGIRVVPVLDKQTVRIVEELRVRGGIAEPVRLYEGNMQMTNFAFATTYHDPFHHVAIVVRKDTLARGRGLAFRYLIGHEMGHAALGHVSFGWDTIDDLEQTRVQHEADAFALRVAGRDAMYVYRRQSGLTHKEALDYIESLPCLPCS